MTNSTQAELAWHKWRRNGIGASEAPVIYLGKVFSTTKMSLFVKKRDPNPPQLNTADNPDFRRGHTYEPLAAAQFEEQTGIKVHYPEDDAERYGPRFCITDIDHDHRRVSLDGICDDGWICEIKAPRQIGCDRIRTDGLKDYYVIQAYYQAAVCQKMGTFAWGPGECKGVRLVVWEPEAACINIFELPYDQQFSDAILESVDKFWTEHVLTGKPPFDEKPRLPISTKGGVYKKVDGDAWVAAAQKYAVAKDAYDAAQARLDVAKELIKGAMVKAGERKIQLPSGIKFLHGEQQGRKSLDLELLKHEHPSIDWDRYWKQGDPFETFRVYGVNKVQRDKDEEEVSGLAVELAHFAKESHDPEMVFEKFNDLRSRVQIFTRQLARERESLLEQLEHAASAAKKNAFGLD
jgi:hypothetical protein